MRKISIILLFSAVLPFAVIAQPKGSKNNHPHWTSKEVHRVHYKNIPFLPARITTGDLTWNVSKGVQQVSANRRQQPLGKVAMTGYPSWTISKGVARMQYEKGNKN